MASAPPSTLPPPPLLNLIHIQGENFMRMFVPSYRHTLMQTRAHTHTCTYIHKHTLTQSHTHTHTHTKTHTYILACPNNTRTHTVQTNANTYTHALPNTLSRDHMNFLTYAQTCHYAQSKTHKGAQAHT